MYHSWIYQEKKNRKVELMIVSEPLKGKMPTAIITSTKEQTHRRRIQKYLAK